MANHNKMVAHQQKHFEGNVGRVYVNPNFNKPVSYSLGSPNNGLLMHINPKFSHFLPNIQHNSISSKSKIYINPNFIRPNNFAENQSTVSIGVNKEIKKSGYNQTTPNEQIVVEPIMKSRYHLVRHNENTQPIKPASETLSNTVKLGKYKSVRIRDIKRTLETKNKSLQKLKPLQTNSLQHVQNVSVSNMNLYANRFKFIKDITAITSQSIKKLHTIKKQLNHIPINIYNKSNNRTTIKVMKGKFKKNNIPCPLFRKFGICLRNAKGTCEFLHDKKHVSICRKFLKGICHDQDCPLSHELTAKKMPTCYFYLNGNCNKEHCPYLHVKLNEKTKICPDFQNGYCEIGYKCLNRHINIRPEVIKKGATLKRLGSFTPKVHKTDVKKIKIKQLRRNKIVAEDVVHVQEGEHSNNKIDCRYYQETLNDASNRDICNIIKPVRCKLGPLPSYIKF